MPKNTFGMTWVFWYFAYHRPMTNYINSRMAANVDNWAITMETVVDFFCCFFNQHIVMQLRSIRGNYTTTKAFVAPPIIFLSMLALPLFTVAKDFAPGIIWSVDSLIILNSLFWAMYIYKIKDSLTVSNIFSLFAIISTCYLLVMVVFNFMITRPTSTSQETTEIDSSNFPDVVACVDPPYKKEVLQKYGYSPWTYYRGGSIDDSRFSCCVLSYFSLVFVVKHSRRWWLHRG